MDGINKIMRALLGIAFILVGLLIVQYGDPYTPLVFAAIGLIICIVAQIPKRAKKKDNDELKQNQGKNE